MGAMGVIGVIGVFFITGSSFIFPNFSIAFSPNPILLNPIRLDKLNVKAFLNLLNPMPNIISRSSSKSINLFSDGIKSSA